jgi:hypothetical protein
VSDANGTNHEPSALPGPAAAEPAPRRRRWPFLLLAVAVLAAAGVAGVLWLRDDDGGGHHPDAWDPRVEEYAEVVEDERDLEFEHPVHVDFLPEEEFQQQVTADEEDLTDEDREDIAQVTGVFRALALIESDLDLFDTMNKLQQAGVIGYYSYDDERIRMRGTELTPDVQSTLVHELTHALQDQHFDLGKRVEELEEADDSAAASAFDAIVEGDARRIETSWREELSEKDRKALDDSQGDQLEDFEANSKDIPDVLETLMATPYAFGEALLEVATQEGGDEAVDALFESPPTTEEHQLDPWSLIEDEEEAMDVAEPELAAGEEEFDEDPFGALGWLVVLGERLPAKQAFLAADGWGGDAYVAFERHEVSCIRVNYRGESAEDLDEMETALTDWAEAGPDGAANVRTDGEMLVFESCDPGPDAPAAATGGSKDAVSLALSRTYLSATLVDSGFDSSQARCSADRLIREFTVEELNSPSTEQERVQQVIAPCLT